MDRAAFFRLRISFFQAAGFALPVHPGSAAAHQFLDFSETRHGSVPGGGHGQRAVSRAVVHLFFRVAGGHQPVNQTGSETVPAADPVHDFQGRIIFCFINFPVRPAHGAPIIDGGAFNRPQSGRNYFEIGITLYSKGIQVKIKHPYCSIIF
jgi:hypothetical protein